MQQAQLVEAAKTKNKTTKTSSSASLKDKIKSAIGGGHKDDSNKGGSDKTASSPRSDSPASPNGTGGPPPLPKKATAADIQDYIFCVECGARNKRFRTACVSCNEELEVPDAILKAEAAAGGGVVPKKKPEPKPDAKKSVVVGKGIESGAQTSEGSGSFQVQLKDSSSEPIRKGGFPVVVQIEGPSGDVEPKLTDNGDGTYSVQYDQSQPGSYQVMVLLDDVEVGDAPFVVDVFVVVSAERSSVSGSALDDGVFAKHEVEITVEARDVCGNPCTQGGAEVEVLVEPQDIPSSPSAQRLDNKGSGGSGAPAVKDNDNGSYAATFTYPAAGTYLVSVLINGAQANGSPFTVKVEKPPTAGSKWQAKFEEEAAQRRKEREQERLQEIERAKKNFLEHAEQARINAAQKEAAQLAEKERLRQIEEHMEKMRTEEGDEVRAAVLEKVKAQASYDIYENVDDPSASSGKKWASNFNEEDKKRREQREAERQAEIAAAKDKYMDHASQAVYYALSKEEKQLAEEQRLREIEEHQRELRLQNNLGGIAALESGGVDDDDDSGGSAADIPPGDDDPSTGSGESVEETKPVATTSNKKPAKEDYVSSEVTASSDDDASGRSPTSPASPRSPLSPRSPVSPRSPRSPRDASPRPPASPRVATSAKKDSKDTESPSSPRKTPSGTSLRSKRGDIPETNGLVLPYSDLKNGGSKYAHDDRVDVNHLEAYLSDAEFQKVMAISKEKFYQLPSWRRQQLKKEKLLI